MYTSPDGLSLFGEKGSPPLLFGIKVLHVYLLVFFAFRVTAVIVSHNVIKASVFSGLPVACVRLPRSGASHETTPHLNTDPF